MQVCLLGSVESLLFAIVFWDSHRNDIYSSETQKKSVLNLCVAASNTNAMCLALPLLTLALRSLPVTLISIWNSNDKKQCMAEHKWGPTRHYKEMCTCIHPASSIQHSGPPQHITSHRHSFRHLLFCYSHFCFRALPFQIVNFICTVNKSLARQSFRW